MARFERRNELKKYLNKNGIEAKIHYPVPLHLQEAAKDLDSNKNVLVILPDSIRNYLSKFVSDEWMTTNGFNI